jgi:hypothetical protein
MIATMNYSAPFRLIAVVLVAMLLVVAATPARAEAIEALTILAIVGFVAAGIVLIAYLIIANTEGDKTADAGRVIWVACTGDDCTTAPAAVEAVLAATPAPVMGSQGP